MVYCWLCRSDFPRTGPHLAHLIIVHFPSPRTENGQGKSEETAVEARLRDDAHPLLVTDLIVLFDLACLQDR